MPHAIFFDMDGHAIHGFFDVKHLGSAVSHGCVRLSPDHARTLFNLVKAGSMSETKVVVAGRGWRQCAGGALTAAAQRNSVVGAHAGRARLRPRLLALLQ